MTMRLKPNIHFARLVAQDVRRRTRSRSYLLSPYMQTLIFIFCCATMSDSHTGHKSETSIDYASIDTAACGKR